MTGHGCRELRDAIVEEVPWEQIPWTTSPRIFKILKEELIKLKDAGGVFLRFSELNQQLRMKLPTELFTPEIVRAVVGLLAGPGILWKLDFGDLILLRPEQISAYASAVIRSVRAHTDEIGCIFEERVLAGDLDYQDMDRLRPDEEWIVLRAMHQIFVDRGLCLRQPTDRGTLLVFPSYFKRESPELEDGQMPVVTYSLTGVAEEIYSTLVVRLHHTTAFHNEKLWRLAAEFRTLDGFRAGVRMRFKDDASFEIAAFIDPAMPIGTKVTFLRYVHEDLISKDPSAIRTRHYFCQHCGHAIESAKAIKERLSRGLVDILCLNCERRVPLADDLEKHFSAEGAQLNAKRLDREARDRISTESSELVLISHAYTVAQEAGYSFISYETPRNGVDGEICVRDRSVAPANSPTSLPLLYLQLRWDRHYSYWRKHDGTEMFTSKSPEDAAHLARTRCPVMLAVRMPDESIRWMDVRPGLRSQSPYRPQVLFDGEPFTALNVRRISEMATG